MKRYSKTVAQQCKYYEVDGNITVFEKLFRELCKEARKDFIDFLLSEVEPIYWREILKIMV